MEQRAVREQASRLHQKARLRSMRGTPLETVVSTSARTAELPSYRDSGLSLA